MEKYLEQYAATIDTMEMTEGVSPDQFKDLILDYIVNVNPDLETVTLRMEGESHTSKLGNLQFRLKELIELIIETAADVGGGNPIALVWKTIQFIKKVKGLSTIPISKNDAKVLVAIWAVKLEKPSNLWPNNEEVREYLKKELTEEAVEASLNNLQELECINRTSQIIIEEEIEF
jgi:hypothetical protein